MIMAPIEPVITDAQGRGLQSPWIMRMFNVILEKPGAALVVIFMLFIGMLTGYIPNKNDADVAAIKSNQVSASQKLDELKVQIQSAVDTATRNGEGQSKLLRGICFILAQQATGVQQQTLLTYCNP